MDGSNMNFGDYSNYPGYMTSDYSSLIQTYYTDLTYLADLLAKLSGTYNALIVSADGINRICMAKKDDIEDALERSHDVGKIIDHIIDLFRAQLVLYENYANMKSDFIINNLPINEVIKSDIEHHIKHEHHEDHHD